jgi:hypothetical protein
VGLSAGEDAHLIEQGFLGSEMRGIQDEIGMGFTAHKYQVCTRPIRFQIPSKMPLEIEAAKNSARVRH